MALLKLDDDLLAQYDAYAQDSHLPVATVVERQLARFVDHPPGAGRVVVLAGLALERLETLLGGGQLTSAGALVARVDSYAKITIGRITLDFTPAQKEEIAHRAQKQGKTPDAVVQDLVAQITDSLFWSPTPSR